jgi:WD40 repeat protein
MDQTIRVWNLATEQERFVWQAHAGGCLQVRFAPDGSGFASSGVDGTVKLWDLQAAPVREWTDRPLPSGVLDALVFPDPGRLALKLSGGQWRVWSLPDGAELHRGIFAARDYTSMKGAGAGRILEGDGDAIQFQRVSDGQVEPFVTYRAGAGGSIDLSRDGRILAVSGDDEIAVWEVATRALLRKWATPREGLGRHVRVSPDGSCIVTLQKFDGTVTFLDVATGHTNRLSGHMIGDAVMGFSADGRRLATAGRGAAIRIYDVTARAEITALSGGPGSASALPFSRDGTRLACGTSKGRIVLWDLRTGREVGVLIGHRGPVYSLAFLDADTLASTTSEEVRLWRAARLEDVPQDSSGRWRPPR